MKTFSAIVLSIIGTSFLGSFILWIIFALIPSSTTGLSFSLLLSMILFSCIIISILGSLVACMIFCFFGVKKLEYIIENFYKMGFLGGVIYLCFTMFFLIIDAENGMIHKYFLGGGFLFHLFVGGVYGGLFGCIYKKIRMNMGGNLHTSIT